jgi:hypothetical protein
LTAQLLTLQKENAQLKAENGQLRKEIAELTVEDDAAEAGEGSEAEDGADASADECALATKARRAATQRKRRGKELKEKHQAEVDRLTKLLAAAHAAPPHDSEVREVLGLYKEFQALYDRKLFPSEVAQPWRLVRNFLQCLVRGPLPPTHIFMKYLLFVFDNALQNSKEHFRWEHPKLSDNEAVRKLQTGEELKHLFALASIAQSGDAALNFLRGPGGSNDEDGARVSVVDLVQTRTNLLLPSQRTLDKGYKDSPFKTDGISPEAVGSFLQKLKDAQRIFDSELPSLQAAFPSAVQPGLLQILRPSPAPPVPLLRARFAEEPAPLPTPEAVGGGCALSLRRTLEEYMSAPSVPPIDHFNFFCDVDTPLSVFQPLADALAAASGFTSAQLTEAGESSILRGFTFDSYADVAAVLGVLSHRDPLAHELAFFLRGSTISLVLVYEIVRTLSAMDAKDEKDAAMDAKAAAEYAKAAAKDAKDADDASMDADEASMDADDPSMDADEASMDAADPGTPPAPVGPSRIARLLAKTGITCVEATVLAGLRGCVEEEERRDADVAASRVAATDAALAASLLAATGLSLHGWQTIAQWWCIGDRPFDPALPMQRVPASVGRDDDALLVRLPSSPSPPPTPAAPSPPPPAVRNRRAIVAPVEFLANQASNDRGRLAEFGVVITAIPKADGPLAIGIRCALGFVGFSIDRAGRVRALQVGPGGELGAALVDEPEGPPLDPDRPNKATKPPVVGTELVLVVCHRTARSPTGGPAQYRWCLELFTKRPFTADIRMKSEHAQVVSTASPSHRAELTEFVVDMPADYAAEQLPTPICSMTEHSSCDGPTCKYPKEPVEAPTLEAPTRRFVPVPRPQPRTVTDAVVLAHDGTDINPDNLVGSESDPRQPWNNDTNLLEKVEEIVDRLVESGAITDQDGQRLSASVTDRYDSRPDMTLCQELLGSIDAAVAKLDGTSSLRDGQLALLPVLESVAAACAARKAQLEHAAAAHISKVEAQSKKYKGKELTTKRAQEIRKLRAAGLHLMLAPAACTQLNRNLEAVRRALQSGLSGELDDACDVDGDAGREDWSDVDGDDDPAESAPEKVGGDSSDRLADGAKRGDEIGTLHGVMAAMVHAREALVTVFSALRCLATKIHVFILQALDGSCATAVARLFVTGLRTDDARILRTLVSILVQHLSKGDVAVAVHSSDAEMALAKLRESQGQPADAGDAKRMALREVRQAVKDVQKKAAEDARSRVERLRAASQENAGECGRRRGPAALLPALSARRSDHAKKGALLERYTSELLRSHTPLRMDLPHAHDLHPIADTDPEYKNPDWTGPTKEDEALARFYGVPWDIAKALRHIESKTRGRRRGSDRDLCHPNLQSLFGADFVERHLAHNVCDPAAELRLFELGAAASNPDVTFADFIALIEQVHYDWLLAELRAAGMDLHATSILPYVELGTTLSPAMHHLCWYHRFKSLVAELRRQLSAIRPLESPFLKADIMLEVLGGLPAGQPRIEALLKSLQGAVDAQNVASAIALLEAPELQEGLVKAGHPFMAIVLKILAQAFAAIDSKGIPREERRRRLVTLRTLCQLMLGTDVHDVHVNHDCRTSKVFGMQRDILFTLMQNCDVSLWVLELHPDMEWFVVDPAVTPDCNELYFSVIAGLLGYKPTKRDALSAMAKVDFMRRKRGDADTRFVVIASSKARYAHHRVRRGRYERWNSASMMRAWPEVLGHGCETRVANRVVQKRRVKLMRCVGTRARFKSIREVHHKEPRP